MRRAMATAEGGTFSLATRPSTGWDRAAERTAPAALYLPAPGNQIAMHARRSGHLVV
jgi:hypothetical protein